MPVEGMIRLEDLTDDWYVSDPDSLRLTGERLGRVWKLGDPVGVRLEEVDMGRLEIRLLPLTLPAPGAAAPKAGKGRGKSRPTAPGARKDRPDGRRRGGQRRKPEDPAPRGRKSRSAKGGEEQKRRANPGWNGQRDRDGKGGAADTTPRRERPRTSAGRPRRRDKAR